MVTYKYHLQYSMVGPTWLGLSMVHSSSLVYTIDHWNYLNSIKAGRKTVVFALWDQKDLISVFVGREWLDFSIVDFFLLDFNIDPWTD